VLTPFLSSSRSGVAVKVGRALLLELGDGLDRLQTALESRTVSILTPRSDVGHAMCRTVRADIADEGKRVGCGRWPAWTVEARHAGLGRAGFSVSV